MGFNRTNLFFHHHLVYTNISVRNKIIVFIYLITELSHLFLRQRIERMKRILLYRTGIFEASKMLANKTRFVEDPRVPAVILAAQPIRIIRWSPATIIGIALKPHGIRGIREIRCRKNRWETSVR